MADTHTESYDLKIKFAFGDGIAPPLTVTLPNPAGVSVVKAGMSTIENLAVDNNIITTPTNPGEYFVEKVSEASIITRTETTLDWRS